MPEPSQSKRDRNLASLRLARACSIDTTGFPLGPLSSRSPHPPLSPGGSSHSASIHEVPGGGPITRAVSHQPSTASGKRVASGGSERTERWVESAMEYELDSRQDYTSNRPQRLTSGMRKSFAIDEDGDDDKEDLSSVGLDEEDEVDQLSRGNRGRRGVTFATEDTVELLSDDGMRLESFERPIGKEMFAIITSCVVLAALSLTAGFATVYDWVL